ncbi:Lin1244/Lin1753 domain-containing protein [uncultured Prevotella sp.]|uniref:Lin1244/Lin1753 domain-containing protein n=1 Tax=uncultured Prevotella sp. TaxID=159272 RepID=UPI002597A081|nr:Lin1244/Lin1753 domain-containing protein [uncultured Prevotella sp.]
MRNTTTRIARERKTRSRRGRKAVRSYPIAASRNDDRILKLRMDHGIEGYAVYHMLMEKIAESDRCEYAIDDYKVLAFDFRVDEQLVKCVAEDYHLFCFNDGRLSLNPNDMPADAGEEDSEEDVEEGGNDCTTASERPYTGTSAMVSAQKKEKENLPLHPLKEKDKEKERAEEKRISLAVDNGGENGSSLKTSENKASDSPDKGEKDSEKGENDCDKGSGTKKAATKENAEASAANEDGGYVNTTSSHSKESTLSAAGSKETRIESFLAYFSNYWNSVLTSTNSRLRPIRVVNGERRKRLVRLRQNYTDEEISRFVFRAANSPYLNARDGRLRQPADLNWMLSTDDRIVKIIEGNM